MRKLKIELFRGDKGSFSALNHGEEQRGLSSSEQYYMNFFDSHLCIFYEQYLISPNVKIRILSFRPKRNNFLFTFR